jgi:hypothetical protein
MKEGKVIPRMLSMKGLIERLISSQLHAYVLRFWHTGRHCRDSICEWGRGDYPRLSAWARTLPRAHGIDSSAEFREEWPRLRPLIRLTPGDMVGLERVAAKPGSSNSIRVNLVCLILVSREEVSQLHIRVRSQLKWTISEGIPSRVPERTRRSIARRRPLEYYLST